MNRAFPTLVLASSLSLVGCSQNAVLEVTVELPGDPGSQCPLVDTDCTYVQFQARDASEFPSFAVNWREGEDPGPAFLSSTVQPDEVSVVSSDATESDLNIRLSFCSNPQCVPMPLGESWFTVERPFYPGERTSVTLSVDSIPTLTPDSATVIPRCQVAGCIEGEDLSTYCVDPSPNAAHFCD